MTTSPDFEIEEFDPQRHDRAWFRSGVERVDNYLKLTVGKLGRSGYAKIFVMLADGYLVGYYAINVHAISYEALPKKYARDRPGHGLIPAAFISMIGVDQRYSGRGYGTKLVVDALSRIVLVSKQIGLAVILLDVLDDGDNENIRRRTELYRRFGFSSIPSEPLRMFLPVETAQTLIEHG